MNEFIPLNSMKWIWKSQSQKEERTMTYNTRIYNYANLHSEDKQIVQAQLLMLESVEDTITNYTYAKETSTNTLETISFEEGINALEEAKRNMYNDIVEYMIFAIDSYENEVYELDTDDPFYGLYVEMEDLENE